MQMTNDVKDGTKHWQSMLYSSGKCLVLNATRILLFIQSKTKQSIEN